MYTHAHCMNVTSISIKKKKKNSIHIVIYVSEDVYFINSIKAKIEKYTKSAMPSLGE